MGVTIELYLRDEVIRGELSVAHARPLDLLNDPLHRVVTLADACAWSLHIQAEPTTLGTVQVQKQQVLLALPHDPPLIAPKLRGGWVEKRPARVLLGLGPLAVTGTLHFGQWERISLDKLGRRDDGPAFLPITDTRVTSQYRPGWSVERRVVLLSRAAISYWCQCASSADEALNDEAGAIEEIYRRLSRHSLAARDRS